MTQDETDHLLWLIGVVGKDDILEARRDSLMNMSRVSMERPIGSILGGIAYIKIVFDGTPSDEVMSKYGPESEVCKCRVCGEWVSICHDCVNNEK